MKPTTLERSRPKYEAILHAIRREIESGALPHGAPIASESELCEQMRVSRGPVRQALAELQRQGLVRRQPGKGSFVNNPVRVEAPAETALRQLLVVMNSKGATPGNFVAHELVEGLSHAAEEAGERYRLSFQFYRNGTQFKPESISGYHGVVMVPFTHDGMRSLRAVAEKLTMPVVSIYNRLDADGVSQFYVDHEAGAFDATELLVRYGHKRIAMLGEPAISPGPASSEREVGFLRAIKAAGLPEGMSNYVRVGVEPLAARSTIENLLRRPDRPTALVIAGGVITPPVLHALRVVKLRVPEDISIIAFDDTPEAAMHEPKIAVVKIPLVRLSRLGMDALIGQTEGYRHSMERVSLGIKPELILSQSIGLAPVAT